MTTGSTSRRAILDRLRTIPIESSPAPPICAERLVRYDDPVTQFSEMLTFVGGQVHSVDHPRQILEILQGLPPFREAKQIASTAPDVLTGNFPLDLVEDPRLLAHLDWAIVHGCFAVAENGAIWVRPANSIERAMLFLTQHLVIVVPKQELVHHMHAAYRRLRQDDNLGSEGPEFGVFVSGPSKTADIEQSLVIGAHGCRTLQVFLVDTLSE